MKTKKLAPSKHEFIGENQGDLDSMNSLSYSTFLTTFIAGYPPYISDLWTSHISSKGGRLHKNFSCAAEVQMELVLLTVGT